MNTGEETTLKTRLTDDLIPEWKDQQNFRAPRHDEDLTFDRHLIGFGNYQSQEWYFIFSDGERSECRTN